MMLGTIILALAVVRTPTMNRHSSVLMGAPAGDAPPQSYDEYMRWRGDNVRCENEAKLEWLARLERRGEWKGADASTDRFKPQV